MMLIGRIIAGFAVGLLSMSGKYHIARSSINLTWATT
jgi:hypothetical protein